MEEALTLLLVDDEEEVRDLLTILLQSYKGCDIKIIGEATSVEDALRVVKDRVPDLILLDIQMPGKDGFQLIDALRDMRLYPGIIFVTAFENYAIRAIRNSAFDYLLKPVNKSELYDAIDRFREMKNRGQDQRLNELVELLHKSKPGRIRLNTRTGYFFINPEDIIFCEADGNYSHLTLQNGKKEISTLNLGNIEKQLDGGDFLRISRTYIINMNYLTRVDRRSNICELEHNGKAHYIKIPPQKIRLLEEFF